MNSSSVVLSLCHWFSGIASLPVAAYQLLYKSPAVTRRELLTAFSLFMSRHSFIPCFFFILHFVAKVQMKIRGQITFYVEGKMQKIKKYIY
jgi:hypothetical protein